MSALENTIQRQRPAHRDHAPENVNTVMAERKVQGRGRETPRGTAKRNLF
jgi:hypothetical protein